MNKHAKRRKFLVLLVMTTIFVIPSLCGATSLASGATQPWTTGFNVMTDWSTGLAVTVATISLAAYLIMCMTGHSGGIATRVLQIVMFACAASQANTIMSYLNVSGTLIK